MSELEKVTRNGSANEDAEFEIDLMEVLLRLLEKWKLIIAGALVCAVLMAMYSFILATPMYEATSKLYVLNSSDSAINLSDLQIGSYLTSDYMEVFDTWEVNEMVRQNLNLSYTREELADMLTLTNPSNTRILNITVTSSDPQEAADIANEYADVAGQYISATMQTDQPSLLSEALTPDKPVSPKKKRNVVLGFLLGALLVCAGVIIQYLLDDKIKNEEDIKKYVGLPTLSVVPDNDEAAVEDRKNLGKTNGGKRRNKA